MERLTVNGTDSVDRDRQMCGQTDSKKDKQTGDGQTDSEKDNLKLISFRSSLRPFNLLCLIALLIYLGI